MTGKEALPSAAKPQEVRSIYKTFTISGVQDLNCCDYQVKDLLSMHKIRKEILDSLLNSLKIICFIYRVTLFEMIRMRIYILVCFFYYYSNQ